MARARSRVKKKARKTKERERRARVEAERKQKLIDEMNSFLNLDNDFESFEDFQDAADNPFDAETNGRQFSNAEEATEDMKRKYKTSDERRRDTFNSNHRTTETQRQKIVPILGSDIYHLFKERYQYDSDQFIDLIKSFDADISTSDIEIALTLLWNDIAGDKVWTFDARAIEEALNLGFTLDEAMELTFMDRQHTTVSKYNVNAIISDYLEAVVKDMIGTVKERERARRQYVEHVKGRV